MSWSDCVVVYGYDAFGYLIVLGSCDSLRLVVILLLVWLVVLVCGFW